VAPGLRGLVYGDLPAVLSIERRSFQTPWSLAMFVLELSKPSGICLAATAADTGRRTRGAGPRGERLAGYLICSRYADVWHLMNIAVAPERRREGIASMLIERLFSETGPGARITLEVRASNSAAIRMYERFGFRPAGHRRRYYHDNGEDALVMWLEPAGVRA
jgi:ribosomal-protein-alanine N-acetyltransferase